MAGLGLGAYEVLIYLNAQTRPLRYVDEAVGECEYVRIAYVVSKIVGLVVVNTLTLFLNKGVLTDCIYL